MKNLLIILSLLVLITSLVAQDSRPAQQNKREKPNPNQPGPNQNRRAEFEQRQPFAGAEFEKCENCPEEKTEEYVCDNKDDKSCCKPENNRRGRDKNKPFFQREGQCGTAQPPRGRQQRGENQNDFMGKSNLTDEQKQKIQTLRENHLKATESKRNELRKLTEEKRSLIKDNKIKDAKKRVDQISKIRADLEKMRIDLMVNIQKEILN